MHAIDHRLLREVRDRWLQTIRENRPQAVIDAARAACRELERDMARRNEDPDQARVDRQPDPTVALPRRP
jgi:hypothetical protein